MLHLFTLTRRFLNFMQSGCYIDYMLKKLGEMFVKNVFIYTSLFFGEKFIIEFISKKAIDNVTFFISTKVFTGKYDEANFFHYIMFFIMSLVVLIEAWFIYF